MPDPTLPDILKPYNVETPGRLAAILGIHPDYARKLWRGAAPISLQMARGLKELTKGAYSIDYLTSLPWKRTRRKAKEGA